ncbi:MAG TPA: pyridoxine 5'-phosphate synthase, partial [Pirellulales bacterium]|nr:pyridoxine 5'-phosphate synthase [Pirellulales bacterium]
HLREDRRHIQDRDLRLLRETVTVKLNLELAANDEVVAIACQTRPSQATLVPEQRAEVTTEGGLDVVSHKKRLKDVTDRLKDAGIVVSLFLDPDERQIDAGAALGADAIELHTGSYALAEVGNEQTAELVKLTNAARLVVERDLTLHAGHGLTYRNVQSIAAIPQMTELNIGHSIVARALMVGFQQAVREMRDLVR